MTLLQRIKKHKIKDYDLIHITAGVITALTPDTTLKVLLFLAFVLYEISEFYQIKDKLFRDILFYAIGLYITSMIIIITEVIYLW